MGIWRATGLQCFGSTGPGPGCEKYYRLPKHASGSLLAYRTGWACSLRAMAVPSCCAIVARWWSVPVILTGKGYAE
eukprot:1137751-Pelagomonas_calceolata.AAC.1